MPALVAVLVYWFRVLRRPMDVRLKRRHVGGSAVLTLGAGMIVLWVQERPMTLPGRSPWPRSPGRWASAAAPSTGRSGRRPDLQAALRGVVLGRTCRICDIEPERDRDLLVRGDSP
jgi:hypothetical protein